MEKNGVINFLKPPGMSSGSAVGFIRRMLGQKKVGHTGTLDPGAGGVLPICAGKSTRLSDILMSRAKSYTALAKFGTSTDTLDSHGQITLQKPCDVSAGDFERVMSGFTGEISQIPPAYSAVKIGGKPAYKRTLAGEEVNIKSRVVNIYDIKYLSFEGENEHLFSVSCSKGTYIRTLIADIASSLGEVAHMGFLCRTSSGGLDIGDSYTMDEIEAMAENEDFSFILPPEEVLCDLQSFEVEESLKFKLDNGVKISTDKADASYRVYCDGVFYGIGEVTAGTLKLTTLLK